MWQLYAIIANDIIRERQAEAEAESLGRLLRDDPDALLRPAGPGRVRRTAASGLRGIGSLSAGVARRASSTASRLEGRPA